MINEFENRKIENSVCEPVEATRIIASYRNVAGPDYINDLQTFYEYMLSIGVKEEDAEWIGNVIVGNGKWELETMAEKFLRKKSRNK